MSNGQAKSANSKSRNGGEQYAFPNLATVTASKIQHGMTLRDYFAGIAMQALVSKESEVAMISGALPGSESQPSPTTSPTR